MGGRRVVCSCTTNFALLLLLLLLLLRLLLLFLLLLLSSLLLLGGIFKRQTGYSKSFHQGLRGLHIDAHAALLDPLENGTGLHHLLRIVEVHGVYIVAFLYRQEVPVVGRHLALE